MTTVVINENSEKGGMLLRMIRAVQHDSDAVVSIRDESFEKIPGMPYTDRERVESVRQSLVDYRRTGKSYTLEEVRAKFPRP